MSYVQGNEVFGLVNSLLRDAKIDEATRAQIKERAEQFEIFNFDPVSAYVEVEEDGEMLGTCSDCGMIICQCDLNALENGYSSRIKDIHYCYNCGAEIKYYKGKTSGKEVKPKEWLEVETT